MRGLVLDGVGQVSYRVDLPDPVITAPTDAVVAVHRAGLCGSDLHPYEGREPIRFGVIPGHEAVGEVVAVGAAVSGIDVGRRVLVPFTTSCGSCDTCLSGLSARCRLGELFGYGAPDERERPALDGGQAEFVRVPLADGTLVEVPDGFTDAEAVLLTDNFPTGWEAAARAGIEPDQTAAVVGLGAVGLCAVASAFALGAQQVVAIDPVESRRGLAGALGATDATPGEALAAVTLASDGRGVGAVIEAAGTVAAQALASSLLRPGGTLSVIAVQTTDRFGFSPVEAYDANLTVRFGRASVRAALDRLLPRFPDGLPLPAELIVTHDDIPLAEGPETYRAFASREGGMVKALFHP